MKTIDDVSLLDIMPDSIKGDTNIDASAKSLDVQFQNLAGHVDAPSIYSRFDELPSGVLDHLAQQYNVSPWRDSWPLALKRSVIRANIATKRKRGTLAAVKECLESFGSAVTVIPWYEQEPKGIPGTFIVHIAVSNNGVSMIDAQEDAMQMLNETKPVSRHYEMVMHRAILGGMNVCGCVRAGVFAKIKNF